MNQQTKIWKQILPEDIVEVQKIIKLLADFDEKTGRYLKYKDRDPHYARMGAALADPTNLKVYINDRGNYVYDIVAEVNSLSTCIVTSWVHEDGIQQERIEHKDIDHPVHSIICVTDLYSRSFIPKVISGTANYYMTITKLDSEEDKNEQAG